MVIPPGIRVEAKGKNEAQEAITNAITVNTITRWEAISFLCFCGICWYNGCSKFIPRANITSKIILKLIDEIINQTPNIRLRQKPDSAGAKRCEVRLNSR